MNESARGCYGCSQETIYAPDTFGPVEDLTSAWGSLDTTHKSLVFAGVLLFLTFVVAPTLIMRRR